MYVNEGSNIENVNTHDLHRISESAATITSSITVSAVHVHGYQSEICDSFFEFRHLFEVVTNLKGLLFINVMSNSPR